jgi:hypothetical protein
MPWRDQKKSAQVISNKTTGLTQSHEGHEGIQIIIDVPAKSFW